MSVVLRAGMSVFLIVVIVAIVVTVMHLGKTMTACTSESDCPENYECGASHMCSPSCGTFLFNMYGATNRACPYSACAPNNCSAEEGRSCVNGVCVRDKKWKAEVPAESSAPVAPSTGTAGAETAGAGTTTSDDDAPSDAQSDASRAAAASTPSCNIQPTTDYGNVICPTGFTTKNEYNQGPYGDCPADVTKPCNRCHMLNPPASLEYINCGGTATSAWPVTATGNHETRAAPTCQHTEAFVNRYAFAEGPIAIATGLPATGC